MLTSAQNWNDFFIFEPNCQQEKTHLVFRTHEHNDTQTCVTFDVNEKSQIMIIGGSYLNEDTNFREPFVSFINLKNRSISYSLQLTDSKTMRDSSNQNITITHIQNLRLKDTFIQIDNKNNYMINSFKWPTNEGNGEYSTLFKGVINHASFVTDIFIDWEREVILSIAGDSHLYKTHFKS